MHRIGYGDAGLMGRKDSNEAEILALCEILWILNASFEAGF